MAEHCEFCDRLELEKFSRSLDKGQKPKIYYECTVALVVRSWTKERGKRNAGRLTDYRNQGIGYKLNFCPECGKDLRRADK